MYWIHTGIPQAPSKAEWLLRLLGAEDSSVTDVPVHLQHEVTRFLCWCYFVLLVRFHFLFIRIQSWTIIMCGQIYHQFEWLHVLLRFIWIVSQTWIHIAHETFSSSYLLSMEFFSLQVEMEKTYGVWGICGMSHLRVPFSLVIKSSLGANSLQSNNKDADVPFIWFSIMRTIMVLAWRERLEFRELGRLFSASMT